MTVLAARPQQGKTRLLHALVEHCRSTAPNTPESFLVGYAQATRQEPDLLLRALKDLYTHWLADATYIQQARILWKTRQPTIVELLGKSAATILSPLLQLTDPTGILPAAITHFFDSMLQANANLTSGGITLPRLQHEQARKLLQTIHELSGTPTILILDALDQSPDPEREVGNLRVFLEHATDWPRLHILTAVRALAQGESEVRAYSEVKKLRQESALVEIVDLPGMDLSDIHEQDRIIRYLRQHVPTAAHLPTHQLLNALDSYPGTLKRWRDGSPSSIEELNQLAADAQALRYREIPPLFQRLKQDKFDHFRAAIRLVLLPELHQHEDWLPYANVVHCTPIQLHELHEAKLLESATFPTFGLTSRYEFIRNHVLQDYPAFATPEAEELIPALADQIRGLSSATLPFAWALANFRVRSTSLPLQQSISVLCDAAISLFSPATASTNEPSFLDAALRQRRAPVLISMVLVNTIAKAQPARREELLDDLRKLAAAHPDDAAVREQLARGLVNTIVEAQPARQEELLDDLRKLAAAHPDNAAVREQLARGLFNTIVDAAPARQEELLDELRKLAAAHPDDAAVREPLAMGLVNTIEKAQPARQEELLDDLRKLATAHPDDAAVRERLAKGLVNTIINAAPARQEELLDDLRKLAAAHPDAAAVREQLAKGLVNTIAKAQPARQEELLDDLRKLAAAHPDDATVREQLARGLVNTIVDAAPARQEELLDELRKLAAAHPSEQFAVTLQRTFKGQAEDPLAE